MNKHDGYTNYHEFAVELFHVGMGLLKSGSYARSLEFFERSLKYDITMPGSWFMKSHILFKLGLYKDALVCINMASVFGPTLSHVWMLESSILERLGFPLEQIEYVRKKGIDLGGWHKQSFDTHLLTQGNQPTIFRYMNEVYIDKFFQTGELRIPTIRKCRSHEDSVRRDESDARFSVIETSDEDGMIKNINGATRLIDERGAPVTDATSVTYGEAKNHFVFCTSVEKSLRLMTHFKTNAILAIHDPLSFAEILRECINQEGYKIYADCTGDVIYWNKSEMPPIAYLKNRDMLKDLKFAHEREFRMLFVPHETDSIKNDYITIYCSTATKFCKKVDVTKLSF